MVFDLVTLLRYMVAVDVEKQNFFFTLLYKSSCRRNGKQININNASGMISKLEEKKVALFISTMISNLIYFVWFRSWSTGTKFTTFTN